MEIPTLSGDPAGFSTRDNPFPDLFNWLDRHLSGKKAETDYLLYLRETPAKPGDLCSICYEPYDPPQQEVAGPNDPPLFFPVDVTAELTHRFPQRKLATGEKVTQGDMYPLLGSVPTVTVPLQSHDLVLMPGCSHLFGRLCICEWLKLQPSCPLCREKIERRGAAEEVRLNVERNCTFVHENRDAAVRRIADELTDVFQARLPKSARVPLHWAQQGTPTAPALHFPV